MGAIGLILRKGNNVLSFHSGASTGPALGNNYGFLDDFESFLEQARKHYANTEREPKVPYGYGLVVLDANTQTILSQDSDYKPGRISPILPDDEPVEKLQPWIEDNRIKNLTGTIKTSNTPTTHDNEDDRDKRSIVNSPLELDDEGASNAEKTILDFCRRHEDDLKKQRNDHWSFELSPPFEQEELLEAAKASVETSRTNVITIQTHYYLKYEPWEHKTFDLHTKEGLKDMRQALSECNFSFSPNEEKEWNEQIKTREDKYNVESSEK